LHPLPEEEHHLTVEAAAVEPSIQRFPALPNVEVVAPATGSANPIQGKGFSSGFNLRFGAR
jgi:hypothetical protein